MLQSIMMTLGTPKVDIRCFKIAFAAEVVDMSLRGGARGVMVIVVGKGHGDTSSNPRRD